MKSKLLFPTIVLAVFTAMAVGCQKDEGVKGYYVPSEVTLQEAVLNVTDMSVTLGAFYNGGDDGIAGAEFLVCDAAGTDTAHFRPDAVKDGVASVKLTGLEKDHDYYFNFVITTPGANKIMAAEHGYCSLHAPYDFVFSTLTTNTAKILSVSFKGSAALAESMTLKLVDPLGNEAAGIPEIVMHEGEIKVLFKLDEWPGELYQASIQMTLTDGSEASSQTENFSTFPMPETLTMLPATFGGDGKWTLTATYDGDDKTVLSAVAHIYNKTGDLLETLTPACSDRQAVAVSNGHEYGKYSWDCTLNLVDGSALSAGPAVFTYAKPREFATLQAPVDSLVKAGISTEDVEGPFNFTYGGYDWENSYIRFKTGKDYIICGSSRKGYICNVTPFEKGIKLVHFDLTQGDRLLSNYEFFAKAKATDEWTSVTGEQPENKVFQLDLSDGDWKYFKFQSKAVKEIRFAGFYVEYFTEDPIEY